MKCPLSAPSSYPELNKTEFRFIDCILEKCAWWDGHGGMCSMLKVSRHLESIGMTFERIEDKMPQDERTRPRP